jgi:hypothetical protein
LNDVTRRVAWISAGIVLIVVGVVGHSALGANGVFAALFIGFGIGALLVGVMKDRRGPDRSSPTWQ